jgi:hypothetical protein
MDNGVLAWASCPAKYVQDSVEHKKHLKDLGEEQWKLPCKCSNPFELDYKPELDGIK